MSRLLIAATRKSSGKTVLTMGLARALTRRGRTVQPFKKGPDYIDPMWLTRAAGRPCINLDFNGMTHDEIRAGFAGRAAEAEVALIEGNKGLYDGLDLEGSDNNAALAMLLRCPVLLVVDCEGMTRGIVPVVRGYQAFEPNVFIAGVVLNNVAGSRHEEKLRAAMERYTDVPVIGAIHRSEALTITERHLGLVTDHETGSAEEIVAAAARAVEAQLDFERLDGILDDVAPLGGAAMPRDKSPRADVRIGIARDSAFCFYYEDDLRAFAEAGAELVEFSPLDDSMLPEVDALFIGGGFPETHGDRLAANLPLRQAIRAFVERGGPVYAECGGLMYCTQWIQWGDDRWDMVGVLPAGVSMQRRPVGRGYVVLERSADHPWGAPSANASGEPIRVHEFNYSRTGTGLEDLPFAWRVARGHGVDGERDGVVYRNLLANYAHQRHTRANPWVRDFVEFVRRCKTESETRQEREAVPA